MPSPFASAKDRTKISYATPSGQRLSPGAGAGAAGELMAWVLDEARARGAEEINLSVFVDNPRARRFYEREGWTDEGDLDYWVEARGERFLSPCRRYTLLVR